MPLLQASKVVNCQPFAACVFRFERVSVTEVERELLNICSTK